jgi:diaminopimelate decarboxylase
MGGMRLRDVVARASTPTYAYDLDAIVREARELDAAFGAQRHLVCYAVKANSAAPIVRALGAEGFGADVVSAPELLVARGCGIEADSIVFSGVAKQDAEIDLAIGSGERGIEAISVESVEEIARIDARAKALGRMARVSIRINPGLEEEALDTHAHIATGHDEAKFGVPKEDLREALSAVTKARHVDLVGISSHIGSQLTDTRAYLDSARALFALAVEIRKTHRLAFVDAGGGFGIDYGTGCPVRPADFVRAVCKEMFAFGLGDLALYVEPGRALVAAHGVLLTRVIQRKVSGQRRWLMIDAGMNDLIRPALYQALHRIVPLDHDEGDKLRWRVVGPVCESSDDFGEHELPSRDGLDLCAILDAGAYGYTMASRYNGRSLPAEVFIANGAIASMSRRADWKEWVDDRLAIGR